MWSLAKKQAQLLHMNTRTEKAGDEDRLACDLKIGITVPNTFLDELCLGLRAALYERLTDKDLLDQEDHRPVLSFPQLAPIEWDRDWTGVRVTLHYGVRDDGDVVLHGATINKLALTLKDGGSVEARFRIQWHPDVEEHPEYMGKLAMMLEGKAIEITVEEIRSEPEPAQPDVIDGTQGPGTSSNPAFDETNEAEGETEAAERETTQAPKARRSRRAAVEAE
jgi:hypothetical protein